MAAPDRNAISSEHEARRIAALQSFHVLDSPHEDIFSELTQLAASVVGTPVALISLIDIERQWFKAKVGMEGSGTPRSVSFCTHAIKDTNVTVVQDARLDPRFANNPYVTGDPNVRFYAAAPLLTKDGYALGTLCVVDYIPRDLSPAQRESLRLLSAHVMAQLELRRQLHELSVQAEGRAKDYEPLRRAIENREFVLHYQPQFDRHGALSGLEALIRWQHPEQGLLAPGSFIPTLEESGLIVEVGRWVVDQAVHDYRQCLAAGLLCPPIAVNVSPRQLLEPSFLEDFRAAIGSGTGSEAVIDIEITENAFVQNIEETQAVLDALRSLGVKVAIDDFGTGYSSLKYLSSLPVDLLKLDQHFVRNMTSSPNDMAIASAVISLAHGLNMKVVAEGVETAAQRQLLGLLRCEYFQGHLYAEATPLPELMGLLTLHTQESGRRNGPG